MRIEIMCPKGPGILPGTLLIFWKLLLLLYHHQHGKECLGSGGHTPYHPWIPCQEREAGG